MLNMLLVYDFWNDYLFTLERIIGLSLIMIGVALAFLAKKITRVVKRQSQIDGSDKTYVAILTFALVIILAGMIVAIL